MIVYVIFACIGVQLFGKLGCTENMPCNGLDTQHANFENFPFALLTLFRIMTGDNGVGIFQDIMRTPPMCDGSLECQKNCCAITFIAPFFFVLFSISSSFSILNIIIAILLNKLRDTIETKEEAARFEAQAAAKKLKMEEEEEKESLLEIEISKKRAELSTMSLEERNMVWESLDRRERAQLRESARKIRRETITQLEAMTYEELLAWTKQYDPLMNI